MKGGKLHEQLPGPIHLGGEHGPASVRKRPLRVIDSSGENLEDYVRPANGYGSLMGRWDEGENYPCEPRLVAEQPCGRVYRR